MKPTRAHEKRWKVGLWWQRLRSQRSYASVPSSIWKVITQQLWRHRQYIVWKSPRYRAHPDRGVSSIAALAARLRVVTISNSLHHSYLTPLDVQQLNHLRNSINLLSADGRDSSNGAVGIDIKPNAVSLEVLDPNIALGPVYHCHTQIVLDNFADGCFVIFAC